MREWVNMMVNSGIKRLDSPLDHIDRTTKATFAPLPKPRTYSFDLSTYRESVRRLGSAPSSPTKPASPTKPRIPSLPAVKPSSSSKPSPAPTRQATIAPPSTISPVVSDRETSDRVVPQSLQPSPANYHPLQQPEAFASSVVADADLLAMPQFQLSPSDLQPTQPVPLTAMNLLRDIEAAIIGWQSALHRVLSQIQQLYSDGPMIDGWLESTSPDQTPHKAKPLRLQPEDDAQWSQYQGQNNYNPEPIYYVCGYTETGELWSRPCPTEQIANISLAISRYQKLQDLLRYKKTIEHYLAELARTILEFHGQVRRIGRH